MRTAVHVGIYELLMVGVAATGVVAGILLAPILLCQYKRVKEIMQTSDFAVHPLLIAMAVQVLISSVCCVLLVTLPSLYLQQQLASLHTYLDLTPGTLQFSPTAGVLYLLLSEVFMQLLISL